METQNENGFAKQPEKSTERKPSAKDINSEEEIITGKIDFTSSREERINPFMLVPKSVKMKDVINEMKNTWKLRIPRIALMIISDPSHRFAWNDRKAIDAFVKGLVKAMNTTEMWIFTDGLNVGISREIAEGFRTEMVKRVTLTCATHHIHKTQSPEVSLIGVCGHESLAYGHNLLKAERPIRIANGRHIHTEGKYDLNPNHSHFIVIKGSGPKNSKVQSFLREMADEMRQTVEYRSQLSAVDMEGVSYRATEVSLIAVVIQGEEDTLDFVLNHLKCGLPVVVINGSGGLADLLAHTYYEVEWMPDGCNFAEYAEKVLKPLLCEKAAEVFSSLRSSRLSQTYFYEKMLQCVRFGTMKESKYLSVLDTNELKCKLEDLPSHLLNALFKCKSGKRGPIQIRNDLFMAMDWNCPDIALAEILEKEKNKDCKISKEHFVKALVKPQREGFVELFLRQGFQVHKFLSSMQLILLFRKSLREDFFRGIIWEGLLRYGPNTEITEDFIDNKLMMIVKDSSGISSFFSSKELDRNFQMDYSVSEQQEAEQKTIVVLVVWAVMSYRMSLVKALWKCSEQPISLALFISMLLKKMRDFSFLDPILKTEIKKHYKEYSSLATGVLDACFKDIPSKAYEIVSEKNPIFAYRTMMEMAAFVQNKMFLAHPCCQKWLDNIFMGNIRFKEREELMPIPGWLKIILSAFLFFPMYYWISFHIPVDKFADLDVGNRKSNERYRAKYPKMEKLMIGNKMKQSLNQIGKRFQIPQSTHCIEIHPNILRRIYYMWSAPITKFWVFEFTYFMYLGVLSLSVIWPSCGHKILDTCVCAWTTLILLDCIYTTYHLKKRYPNLPVAWRWLEIAIILVLVCTYLLGRVVSYTSNIKPYSTKVLLCLGLLFFYYRLIFISLPMSSQLGPLLYRVKRMIVLDFVNFMRMALLFMISNGIVLQAVLYPDFPVSKQLFYRTFEKIWIYLFKVPSSDFGQLNQKCIRYIERPYDENFCRAGNFLDAACPNVGLWPYVLVVQYLMLLKLVLITMLYALFSTTQKKLQEESDFIWKFQRYQLVVEFSQRLLPAPISVFSYIAIVFKSFKRHLSLKHKHSNTDAQPLKSFISSDFVYEKYWSKLSTRYCKEIVGEGGTSALRKEMEDMNTLKERMRLQKQMITDLESRISELQVQLNYTRKYLDTSYHSSESEHQGGKSSVQELSRYTPYPDTKVQRFPVPNNRVPWKIQWAIYDPVAYTRPKEDFHSSMRSFVDDDVHIWLETHREDSSRPVFQWNQASQSPAGVFLNRQSWITDSAGNTIRYDIDSEGLPRNPMGRTGLRGKGCLPRWGPNHLLHILVTRWGSETTGTSKNSLEFIMCKTTTMTGKQKLTLPGGFVTTQTMYDAIASFFQGQTSDSSQFKWRNSEDMIEFFSSCMFLDGVSEDKESENMLSSLVYKGYMDDPENTDQAWFELELWHVHYNVSENVEQYFGKDVQWQVLDEEILSEICEGIAQIIKTQVPSMKIVL